MLFITAVIWGVAFVFQRTGMDHIGPLTFMAARCTLAVLFLAVLVMIKEKKPLAIFEFNKPTLIGGLFCGLFLTAANNMQQIGIVNTSAGKAGFITAMYIVLVPFANFLVFRIKPSKKEIAGAILGVFGLYLLCVKEGFTITTGDKWVLGCAFLFTGHILCTDKYSDKADPIKMSMLQFVVSSVLGWLLAFIFEVPTFGAMWEARIAIGYVGILSAGVAYTLQIVGQKYTDPTAASLIMSLESVTAALSGWLLLHETLSAKELIGCVIMFIAILIVEIKGKEK